MACQPSGNLELDKLNAERDSLKTVVQESNARITEINQIIAESGSDFENNLTLVESQLVTPQEFDHYFEIYGEVETNKNILLYPETQGPINSIKVKEGQRVSKGQSLASIDNQIVRSQLAELETNYALAQTTFEKQKRLWDQKIGSEMQYLQAKNQKESLESSMSTLQSQLSKSLVRAPFAGVVDEIFPNQGEMATPGMAIFRIVNLDNMFIESDVSEQHLLSVKSGTPVVVDFPTMAKSLEVTISESSKFINPENRSFRVRVDLPKNEIDLRPNQMAHLRINDYKAENALVLPSSIVMQSSQGDDFVFILEERDGNTYAKRLAVTTGHEYEGKVEIMSGLEKDMQVISKGAKSVRDGQRVRLS
jgi:RND family efflux transporter MFP subunit